jgi:FkbM family methyltransferase
MRRSLTLVLVALIAINLAALMWMITRPAREIRVTTATVNPSDVVKALEARYGPQKYSMGPEEWILRELVQDRREGVFVDVGASDARVLSNTYYLESALGWSGIAIDPQTAYAADYARYRPRTRFRPAFVSDRGNVTLPFYIAAEPGQSSADRAWAQGRGGGDAMTVVTTTLDDLLTKEGVGRFDLLSMDIEGHELQALAGLSIERYRPDVVVVEAHPPMRQALLEYFARHAYVVQAKYLEADSFNLYFRPLSSGGPAGRGDSEP